MYGEYKLPKGCQVETIINSGRAVSFMRRATSEDIFFTQAHLDTDIRVPEKLMAIATRGRWRTTAVKSGTVYVFDINDIQRKS